MGSVMDFGTRAGDCTPEWTSVSYNWNSVNYMFPNLSTWHSLDHDNTFIHYLLSHRHIHLQKTHPSAFVTVGLVLQIVTRGCRDYITWNSKRTTLKEPSSKSTLQQTDQSYSLLTCLASGQNSWTQCHSFYQLPDILILPPTFIFPAHFTVHHPNPVTIMQSDCTLQYE